MTIPGPQVVEVAAGTATAALVIVDVTLHPEHDQDPDQDLRTPGFGGSNWKNGRNCQDAETQECWNQVKNSMSK